MLEKSSWVNVTPSGFAYPVRDHNYILPWLWKTLSCVSPGRMLVTCLIALLNPEILLKTTSKNAQKTSVASHSTATDCLDLLSWKHLKERKCVFINCWIEENLHLKNNISAEWSVHILMCPLFHISVWDLVIGVNELNLTLCQCYKNVSTFPGFTDEEMIETKVARSTPTPWHRARIWVSLSSNTMYWPSLLFWLLCIYIHGWENRHPDL